ncbi:hypothetical protein GCM10010151_10680 [Actinoallomurus spadix]|uniref:Uncharacterized protein n=1 Tax=Actinoallomurus spadix TaxID=79912 RepID=A0ABP3FRV1_9ACTN
MKSGARTRGPDPGPAARRAGVGLTGERASGRAGAQSHPAFTAMRTASTRLRAPSLLTADAR